MNVVVALDAFKGSISSTDAGAAVKLGVLDAIPTADVSVHPVADGGEGTLDAAAHTPGAVVRSGVAPDTFGWPVHADWVELRHDTSQRTALVEAAQTLGVGRSNPTSSTGALGSSYGLGIQIREIAQAGITRVKVALGGTLTTDGGSGLLAALGAQFSGPDGRPLRHDGTNLLWIGATLVPGSLPRLDFALEVLCDVANPLLGDLGAVSMFGPQKGLDGQQLVVLETHMENWVASLERECGRSLRDLPGAGAAGGIGAALLALGASPGSGFDLAAEASGLDAAIRSADLILVGEGHLDHQTPLGKAPWRVAQIAQHTDALVVGLGGAVSDSTAEWGIHAAFAIQRSPGTLRDAMSTTTTSENLRQTAREVTRLVDAARRLPARDTPAALALTTYTDTTGYLRCTVTTPK